MNGRSAEKISVERAQELIRESVGELECEYLPAEYCAGRILGEDLTASMTQPPFPRSAMDGYAVRAEDIAHASKERPCTLKVTGRLCAGMYFDGSIRSGEAVRIMTGAAVPQGADCVVRQEDTDWIPGEEGADTVKIYRPSFRGSCVCPAGEDFCQGEVLARKGDEADAYTVACAVAAGLIGLNVRRKLRAAVITTGDELQKPGDPLKPGQIYNSNMAYLKVRLAQMNCEAGECIQTGDSLDEICRAAEQAAKDADVIITTGGVSVGEKDLIPEILERLNAQIIFRGMEIKPGMPTIFSLVSGTPVLSLSGNPYSAFAVFELLFPVLRAKMYGENGEVFLRKKAVAGDCFRKSSPVRRLLRGRYDGERVWFSGSQGNGQLKGGIGTNCLIEVEEGSPGVCEGDEVTVLLVERISL